MLEIRGVAKRFDPATPLLDGVDLTVARGEWVAIVGESGSGKSTLLNLIAGLDRPERGEVRLDSAPLPYQDDDALALWRRHNVGFVFQAFHLLPYRTALENVLLAGLYNQTSRGDRIRAAAGALDAVGLGHRLDALPTTLSGGECQRVAIARALVNRPSLLLCDEPTGNLDSRNAAALMELLDQLNAAGFTIVVITHDVQVAAHARRAVDISDGVLSERREASHA